MTDNKIIKALECCIRENNSCKDCPYSSFDIDCTERRNNDCIDLINRQKAEIERLKKETEQFADIGKLYSEIRAEAIKEFADRLKGFNRWTPTDNWYIDNLVKEMVGEGG